MSFCTVQSAYSPVWWCAGSTISHSHAHTQPRARTHIPCIRIRIHIHTHILAWDVMERWQNVVWQSRCDLLQYFPTLWAPS